MLAHSVSVNQNPRITGVQVPSKWYLSIWQQAQYMPYTQLLNSNVPILGLLSKQTDIDRKTVFRHLLQ